MPNRRDIVILLSDYFTKWVEAIPMKSVDQKEIVEMIKTYIVHRFGIPETIVADQGTVFTGGQVRAFAEEYGITIQNLTPYYAQGNGQAEASNKVLINISPLLCRCSLNYSQLV